jgi:hypothetical protein
MKRWSNDGRRSSYKRFGTPRVFYISPFTSFKLPCITFESEEFLGEKNIVILCGIFYVAAYVQARQAHSGSAGTLQFKQFSMHI